MNRTRASVLIVVLWASVGLVSVSLLFGHSMLMSYRGADNDFAARQSDQAIEGAVRYVQSLLLDADTPGVFPALTSYVGESVPVGDATFWFLGRSLATYDGTVREYALVDEASKLNLNTVAAAQLSGLPGMTTELADAIVQWRGGGGTSVAGGVAGRGNEIKGAPFESVEELALVPGMTRTILFGEDANLNGVLDPSEDDGDANEPSDNADGKLDPGVIEYVTVFSREPLVDADGTDRIAIGSVPPGPPPTELINKVREVLPDEANDVEQRLGTQPLASVMQFYVRSGLSQDSFARIADYLTAGTAAQPWVGVNIFTASEAVLARIPGISADQASSLVAARSTLPEGDQGIDWFRDALGQGADAASANFTVFTHQVSVDVAAVGRFGRGYRRERVVIDSSTGTPRQPRVVYRRNLSPLGWALGGEVREQLAQNKEVR